MGFPRILSKNNKIYTKLGEFCLSGDASFWIVCQVCQEELQTQDQFWKHIQDEHNFMHGLGFKQEQARNYMEPEATTTHIMPLPLYRKVNEEELRASGALEHGGDNSQEKQEPKDYTEMRAIEPNAVEIDIKVEPPSIRHALALAPPPPVTQNVHGTGAVAAGTGAGVAHQNVEVSTAAPALYQLPQVTPASAYGTTIIHSAPTLTHTMGMTNAAAAAAALMSQEMPKESNSTTASASSAISSEDGERWYVCDYETCGLKFKYQSRLELHRAVHSKERRFACELCGASFKQSCNLSTHRKKKHFLKGSKGLVPQRF
ncbi:AT-rich binding protein [Zeugodacus cucurbitae]|uniref:AT-rich binding protein n=1 Tax=Zeugodacus cucurbitae TaxID=28588 RepID=UPI0023D8F15A|nr:AT-rich binding protein [Zeugodacus cucurbitae]